MVKEYSELILMREDLYNLICRLEAKKNYFNCSDLLSVCDEIDYYISIYNNIDNAIQGMEVRYA